MEDESVGSSPSAWDSSLAGDRHSALELLEVPIGRASANAHVGDWPGADFAFEDEHNSWPSDRIFLGDPPDDAHVVEPDVDEDFSVVTGLASEYTPSIFDGDVVLAPEQFSAVSQAQVSASEWNIMIAGSFSDYKEQHHGMLLPWETGTCAGVFTEDYMPSLPTCSAIPEMGPVGNSNDSEGNTLTDLSVLPVDAKYIHIVQSMKDLEYFEGKALKLDQACAQWLQILSVNWEASGVGVQLAASLQADNTGNGATEILRACFGVKSPATLLKRASAIRSYINWFERNEYGRYSGEAVMPFGEDAVWFYFLWLKEQRLKTNKGFTNAASFLEALRFCKHVLDFQGIDSVVTSRRLQGFAAIQKSAKGPLRQAPGLELEHMRRLHEVLRSDGNPIDRLAAGCFLICLYGRARWSDTRYIQYVEIDNQRNGSLTLYTSEHKTAGVGLRREQFLPLIVPWQGVTSDPWLETFLELYSQVGLNIHNRPLGPLLPAPRPSGGFYARPVTTSEAASWLRALLEGTTNSQSFRSHSLKASLLLWCAQAGFDKETRAILGHHCSSLTGSEVVYSRHLQVRAIRKLSMLLRRVRIGLSIEDENMQTMGLSTPAAFTPVFTGNVQAATPHVVQQDLGAEIRKPAEDEQALSQAVEVMQELEDFDMIKEELVDEDACIRASASLSLFPQELVDCGLVEIESSSGSDSSSSSDDSSPEMEAPSHGDVVASFSEKVPEGTDYYRHKKSSIMHRCKAGSKTSACNVHMGANFAVVSRVFYIKWPKCLKCFPSSHNRITKLGDLNSALGDALKRAKKS